MSVHISHRANLAGRRPVLIDGERVGECQQVPVGSHTQILFYLPGEILHFAAFATIKDLRSQLPSMLSRSAP